MGHYNDNCSSSPDHPLGMNFVPACQSHDYGYALGRAGAYAKSSANKNYIDRDFWNNLALGTCPHYYWMVGTCVNIADTYYVAVKYRGHF